jgi:pimeloyl-ACP methyl ester carboxylesterase
MKKLSKKIQILLLRTYLNTLAHFSESKAGEMTSKLFFTPRKGQLTDDNRQTLSSATWEMLSLRDINIQTYRWEGTKQTILLAHGWESNSARWQQLIKKLRKNGFTVIAVDAPAHGGSGSPNFNAFLYAEMIQVAAKHFAPTAIIGHSAGGFAAAFYATHFLDPSVSQLVLLAAPSELNQVFNKSLDMLNLSDKVRRGFYQTLQRILGHPLEYFSIQKFVKTLSIKGLIIHDKDDTVCDFTDGENIHANWKTSKFIPTEGYGHRLQNEKINTMVVDYLKKELSEIGSFAQ